MNGKRVKRKDLGWKAAVPYLEADTVPHDLVLLYLTFPQTDTRLASCQRLSASDAHCIAAHARGSTHRISHLPMMQVQLPGINIYVTVNTMGDE